MKITQTIVKLSLMTVGLCVLVSTTKAAAPSMDSLILTDWQKPAWLTDLGLGLKEGYDNNILLVSGNGMPEQSSWITMVSPKLGVNVAPLLGKQSAIQTASLAYAPDYAFYHNAPSETYKAHRFLQTIKAKSGDFSVSSDNSLLYNDGSDVAETYALNQLAGAAANQNDKYRNFYAQGVPRERRNQIQDRGTVLMQYD